MPSPQLAARLRAGETLYSGWVGLPEPLVAEVTARAGFGCVTLDMQHGLHDTASVMRGISAIALAGKPSVVRVPVGDNAMASRALDMGAEGIIAPMINTVAEAKALVAATKYPPVGERSWGPARALALQGIATQQAYLEQANSSSFVFAMIETVRAMESLDAILAVDGIDGVFVGPSDLSVTLSEGKRIAPFDAFLDQHIRHIAVRTAAAGKVVGAFAANADRARHFRNNGYRFIALAGDQVYLANGANEMLQAALKN
jgi:4-hydroxy-2-oxoheptanedioate aldolase